MSELPYYGLSNTELQKQLTNDRLSMMFDNNEFVDYLNNLNSSCLLKELNFQYVTEEQLTAKLKKLDRNIELSVFHMNIRSLNSKQRQICQLFELLDYEFDVIILTEIWTVNINFYANLFTGYDFYYDLPQDSKVGGVGLFIRNTCTVHSIRYSVPEHLLLKISGLRSLKKVENILLEEYIDTQTKISQTLRLCLNLF